MVLYAISHTPGIIVLMFHLIKPRRFICTAGDPVYIGVPWQATGDVNPQILDKGNSS